MRKRISEAEDDYDYSTVGYARRAAIRALDEYECSVAEIVAMFGRSEATFHRYDRDVRLQRRLTQPACRYPMSPKDAREIALIALIRAGYGVAVIAEALHVSQATVYRERARFEERRGTASPAELRHIRRNLKSSIIDDRPQHQRRVDAQRRGKRWRRGSRGKFSS